LAKNSSFGFLALAFVSAKNQMCCLCDWLFTLTHNVLALGEEADFEALNCQPSTKFDTRQNVQLTTEPAFLPNAC
jgi:hypothetical protein